MFANGSRDLGSIPGRVIPKTLEMVLDTSCLTLSNIRYVSSVKWNNPGKGVAPSPTPRCSSYWKGSLLVVLDYGCQLNLLYYIDMRSFGCKGNKTFMKVYLCSYLESSRLTHTLDKTFVNTHQKLHFLHISFYVCLCVSVCVCLYLFFVKRKITNFKSNVKPYLK